jgi:TPR repeat protein
VKLANALTLCIVMTFICTDAVSQGLNAAPPKPTMRPSTSATVTGNNNIVINSSDVSDRTATIATAIANATRPPATEFVHGDELEPIRALETGDEEKRDIAKAFSLYERAAQRGNPRARVELGRLLIEVGSENADTRAYREFDEAARAGNADAVAWQAWMHDSSRAQQRSTSTAVALYERAANAGVGWAAFKLGVIHQKPALDVSRDEEKALKWYWRAAELYFPAAYSELSWILRFGEPKHRNSKEAIRLLEQGAKLNDCSSLFHLAYIYHQGENVPQDYQTAFKYYRRASACGDNRAQSNLGNLFLEGLGTTRNPEAAAANYRTAALRGNAIGAVNLGRMYEKGNGLPRSAKDAASWYQLASDQGYAEAKALLSTMYRDGNGVKKDLKRCHQLLQEAVKAGNSIGMFLLGVAYEYGDGVEKSKSEAASWYRKAIELGNVDAMNNLANGIDNGTIQALAGEDAFALWKRAAEAGNHFAQFSLGTRYLAGKTVEADERRGIELLRESAQRGFLRAKVVLADALYRRSPKSSSNIEEAVTFLSETMKLDSDSVALIHSIAIENSIFVSKKDADYAISRLADLAIDATEPNQAFAIISLATAVREGKKITLDTPRLIHSLFQIMEKGNEQAALELFLLYGKNAPELFFSSHSITLIDNIIANAGKYAPPMRIQRDHFTNPTAYKNSEDLLNAMDQAALNSSPPTKIAWMRTLAPRRPDLAGTVLRSYIQTGEKLALNVFCELVADYKLAPVSASELARCIK